MSISTHIGSYKIVVDQVSGKPQILYVGQAGYSPLPSQEFIEYAYFEDANTLSTASLANIPLAFRFAFTALQYSFRYVPLNNYTHVRLIAHTQNVNYAGTRLKVMYKTGAWSLTYANWSNLADTGECALDLHAGTSVGTAQRDSGWVALPASLALTTTDILVGLADGGGDGAVDCTIYSMSLFFKGQDV